MTLSLLFFVAQISDFSINGNEFLYVSQHI